MSLVRHRGGSGEPVVLIHGLGSHAPCWDPIVPLLEREREVITLDMPGFGRAPGGPADVPGVADAVQEALGAEGIERPHYVGNSMGGWVSIEIATRGGAGSVVALSPAGLSTPMEEAKAKVQLLLTYANAKWGVHLGERPHRHPRMRDVLHGVVRKRGRHITPAQAFADLEALAFSKNFMRMWWWTFGKHPENLERITCPVLIAWGEDRLLPRAQGPRYAARIPGAELQMLRGVGHLPMADDPELIARTILEFQDRRALSRPAAAAAP